MQDFPIPPVPMTGLVQPVPNTRYPLLGLVTWNVNGLCRKLPDIDAFHRSFGMPQIWCFQETKCEIFPKIPGYVHYGSAFRQPAHHGVAIYVREDFPSVRLDVHPELNGHAIAIQLVSGPIIVSAYVKNSGTIPHDVDIYAYFKMCENLRHFEASRAMIMATVSAGDLNNGFRMIHDVLFWHAVEELNLNFNSGGQLIVAGDMNTCLNIDDHHSGKKCETVPGLRSYESANMSSGMNICKLQDAYVHYAKIHKRLDHEKWTFWPSRGGCSLKSSESKPNGSGWRLDYILAQNLIFSDVKVLKTNMTDHSPLALYF